MLHRNHPWPATIDLDQSVVVDSTDYLLLLNEIAQCPKRERTISRVYAPSWCGRERISPLFGVRCSKVMPSLRASRARDSITGERLVFDGDAKEFSVD